MSNADKPHSITPHAVIQDGKIRHYANILSATALFHNFSQDALLQVCNFSEEIRFAKDQYIFSHESATDCMYIIIQGEVMIEKKQERVSDQLAQYTDGEVFGETGIFLDSVRGADARALDSALLLRFPASNISLEYIMQTDPVFCALMFNTFISHVAHRIRSINELISKNNRWVNALKEQLIIDKVTSLYTLASYKEEFMPKLANTPPVVVVMTKPRNFKTINDRYGHGVGDAILHKMGTVFVDETAGLGYVFRYMGNEFATVSNTLSKDNLTTLVNKIINQLVATDLRPFGAKEDIRLSFMSYVADFPNDHSELSSLLDDAHKEFLKVFSRA